VNPLSNLCSLRIIFDALVTGWPVHANFPNRREVTIIGFRRLPAEESQRTAEIHGVLEGRDILMKVNIQEGTPDYGSGVWEYVSS